MNRELESPDIWNNPEHAQTLGRERASLEKVVNGIRTLTDPVKNVHLGVLYLAEMREHFGDTQLAMAAYNIGPYAVKKRLSRGKSVKGPYVYGVLQRFHSLRLVFGDPTTAIGC